MKCIDSNSDVFLPNLHIIAGFDVNTSNTRTLHRNISKFLESMSSSSVSKMNEVQIWRGSILSPDFLQDLRSSIALTDIDGVACIEVIEHLPSVEDATQAALNILSFLQPRLAIFTTPNHEANKVIYLATKNDRFKVNHGPFREEDHKFELSRKQFQDWSADIIERLDTLHGSPTYTTRFFEVGDLSNYPEGKECGGATQGVIFCRDPHYLPTSNLISEPERKRRSDLEQTHELCMQWSK